MWRRVLGPWNAAAMPGITTGALRERKRDVPAKFYEGQAVGQQPSSAAGARGSGAAEARARPNVEVNRRAEGTSELNRRLGAGVKGAVALERCGVAGDYRLGLAGKQAQWKASSMCMFRFTKAEQQASNQAALPESEEVERQEPERGLTLRLTGVPKARPS